MARRDTLDRRLTNYWRMEAMNMAVLPLAMLYLSEGQLGWMTAIALVPMVLLLGIGALYWREKLLQLKQPGHQIRPVLVRIAWLRLPCLLLTITALALMVLAWAMPGLSRGLAERVCVTASATLALLEYVNYYHRQVQHFDHLPDIKRLFAGKGFRPSQMARDLRALGL